jgi:protein involved in polysaccharide export with SLBB domain
MSNAIRKQLGFQISSSATFTALFAILVVAVPAQTSDGRTKNNPYFPSPSAKVQRVDPPRAPVIPTSQVSISTVTRNESKVEIVPAVAKEIYNPVKNVEARSFSPEDIYRVGVGDIIFVNLKNAPNSSGYYTVKANGMIDFPLAGDKLVVTGRTAIEVAQMLAAGITLYPDPRVEVKVRDYRSHKITVSGMVEQSGESTIQREAIPLYVVCAQAGVDPKATKALVRRSDVAPVETFDLHDANSDKILIFPGNAVEFTADTRSSALINTGFYYIGGSINSAGQKEFAEGITLSQAIAASGGAKGNPKKVSIRRKVDKGTLKISEFDLRAIKDRKIADPALSPGDRIEVGN